MNHNQDNNRSAFITLTSLFFMWGLITVLVDSLIPRIKEIFEIGQGMATLVQFAFFLAYGLLSIPSSFILKKVGYKNGIMLGLGVMGIGCLLFYPAASFRIFPLFMLGYFTLAGGMTILQVAANPYITVLGNPETASSRLNLSQAFNSLGTAIAPIIGAIFILSDNIMSSVEITSLSEAAKQTYYEAEAAAVQAPFIFLAISLLALAAFVFIIKLPKVIEDTNRPYKEVLSNSLLIYGAVGIFVYVGAEVAISSLLPNYLLDMGLDEMIRNDERHTSIAIFILSVFGINDLSDLSHTDAKGVVGAFNTFYWSGAMVGRAIGFYLTKKIRPSLLLSVFGAISIALVSTSIATEGFVSMWTLIAVGLFNSIMFPTIFALSISKLGNLKPQGSGILCTAILGGGIIPPICGFLSDSPLIGFKGAFILIVLCYGYIVFFGKYYIKLGNGSSDRN